MFCMHRTNTNHVKVMKSIQALTFLILRFWAAQRPLEQRASLVRFERPMLCVRIRANILDSVNADSSTICPNAMTIPRDAGAVKKSFKWRKHFLDQKESRTEYKRSVTWIPAMSLEPFTSHRYRTTSTTHHIFRARVYTRRTESVGVKQTLGRLDTGSCDSMHLGWQRIYLAVNAFSACWTSKSFWWQRKSLSRLSRLFCLSSDHHLVVHLNANSSCHPFLPPPLPLPSIVEFNKGYTL